MPTVAEILKATGLDDAAIAALDPKLVQGFTTVISTAQQEREAAELQRRAVSQQFENEISPALDNWANEKAAQNAEMSALRAALKSAEEGGFKVPAILNAPVTPARSEDGKFVAGANDVPGSPKFVQGLRDELGGAFAFLADTSWKYRSLYGTEMPDPPTSIIREAQVQRMSPADYAAKKYDFAGKEAAKRAEDQKKHDDTIRAEAKAASDKEWSERVGNNPNLRAATTSAFSTVNKAVAAGERKDPLTMSREQRHLETRGVIQKEIAENETVQ